MEIHFHAKGLIIEYFFEGMGLEGDIGSHKMIVPQQIIIGFCFV
jgi:hypothetical protein